MVNTREHFRDLREVWRLEGFREMFNYDICVALNKYTGKFEGMEVVREIQDDPFYKDFRIPAEEYKIRVCKELKKLNELKKQIEFPNQNFVYLTVCRLEEEIDQALIRKLKWERTNWDPVLKIANELKESELNEILVEKEDFGYFDKGIKLYQCFEQYLQLINEYEPIPKKLSFEEDRIYGVYYIERFSAFIEYNSTTRKDGTAHFVIKSNRNKDNLQGLKQSLEGFLEEK